MSTSYSEKLTNPKWQKKRLEILSRDKFTCQLCSDTDTMLHVHHKSYTKGAEPWEYEDSNFISLCKYCHRDVEEFKRHNYIVLAIDRAYREDFQKHIVTSFYINHEGVKIVSLETFDINRVITSSINISEDTIKSMGKMFDLRSPLI